MRPAHPPGTRAKEHRPASAAPTPCGSWMASTTSLHKTVTSDDGEIDDCEALDGVWVLDTDQGAHGIGVVGVHVCSGDCSGEEPADVGDWRFYTLTTQAGTDERLAGDENGKALFEGRRR